MNMLRPESYLSPFLLSYLSKYIKDVEPKNFQLSLWGGDAVLHNVKFKLDALENELHGAPFSFLGCQAQELRMHVPWSKLASEPVVITLNTMECVLKLECCKKEKHVFEKTKDQKSDAQPQPSYIDGLITKIKNNIKIVVNNLILKYMEDDLILSINIQKLMCCGADETWKPSFVEMTDKCLVLRHLYELKDITVCLDRRDASGHVESYEDPMLFRCHVFVRQHATYPSLISRKSLATKWNVMIDRFELNISEMQLPGFLRLLQLSLHIYYGTILITRIAHEEHTQDLDQESSTQGWGSWAWSYMPSMVSYDGTDEMVVTESIMAFGIYVKHFKINLKPSNISSTQQFHLSSPSGHPAAMIEITAHGISVEVVAKGLEFFSCTTCICSGFLTCTRTMPFQMFDHDFFDLSDAEKHIVLVKADGSSVGFLADSLFDFRAPENNDVPCVYCLTKEDYFRSTEKQSKHAFHAQYLYIATDGRNDDDAELEPFNDYLRRIKLTDISQWGKVKEISWKQFAVGGEHTDIAINSHFMACCDTFLKWGSNHNFKNYPTVSNNKIISQYKPGEIPVLPFVPYRSAVLMIQNLTIAISALHLKPDTFGLKEFCSIHTVSDKDFELCLQKHSRKDQTRLPVIFIKLPCSTSTMKQPMYAQYLAAHLSLFRSPPPVLMQACNTQYTVDVGQIDIFLGTMTPEPEKLQMANAIMTSVSVWKGCLLELYVLQSKEHWCDRQSMLKSQSKFCMQSVKCSLTLVQLELLLHVIDSWLPLVKFGSSGNEVLDVACADSLLASDAIGKVELVFNTIIAEINQSFAVTYAGGALVGIEAVVHTDHSQPISILHCKCDQAKLVSHAPGLAWSEESHWFCIYMQIPHLQNDFGCVMMHMQQVDVVVAKELFAIISQSPAIPLRNALPALLASPPVSSSPEKPQDNFVFLTRKWKYSVQLQSKGVHLCIPASGLEQSLKTSTVSKTAPGIHICFPVVMVCTSGHKHVKVAPSLLAHHVVINNFTEFHTLNCSMEKAELFTVSLYECSTTQKSLHVVDPCAAACTVALTPSNGQRTLPAVALHLDVEPVSIRISQTQLEMLIDFSNFVVLGFSAFFEKCMTCPPSAQEMLEPETITLSGAASSDVQQSHLKDDSKSDFSAMAKQKPLQQVSCTVWLQCTLPRFQFAIYSVSQKTAVVIEDVSLSLDYHAVYLKLVSTCSACTVSHFANFDGQWKQSWQGVTLSPMLSQMPSFLQTYDPVPHYRPRNTESDTTPACRKFCEVTFTQALTSDYHQHLQDELQSSVDIASSEGNGKHSIVKQSVSELVCQVHSFDLLVDSNIVYHISHVFAPLWQLNGFKALQTCNTHKDKQSIKQEVDIPSIFFNIGGIRLFFPCSIKSLDHNDVLMLCAGAIDINPHPLNPLPRLVLAPSLYKKAEAAGLLNCSGSVMEDKQIEISLQSVSLGTTRWKDILSHLNRPKVFENPALQWNIAGKLPFTEDPVFNPVVQGFDFQATIAPSIWYINNRNRWIHVCAPSLEAGFTSDVVVHLTAMQVDLVVTLLKNWFECFDKAMSSVMQVEKNTLVPTLPEDSGLSAYGSSRSAKKPVVSTSVDYMGDALLTAHNVSIMVYHFIPKSEKLLFKPDCCFVVREPSLLAHVSRHQQKVELQVHDVFVSVANKSVESKASINVSDFSTRILETLPGDCDERTGVPSSLLIVTAQHFLSSKATVKACVGRPVKFFIGPPLMDAVDNIKSNFVRLKSQSVKSTELAPTYGSQYKTLSSLEFNCKQLVTEFASESDIMRLSLACASIKTEKSAQKTEYNVTVGDITMRLKAGSEDFVPVIYPVTVHACFSHLSKVVLQGSVVLTMMQVFFSAKILESLKNIQKPIENLAAIVLADDVQDSSLPAADPSTDSVVTKNDDLRSGIFTYITADDQEPLPHQIVFSTAPSCMSWCYDKPYAVQHLHVTPVPFNVSESGKEILCLLQSFNEVKKEYEEQARFFLSETDDADLTLFTSETSVHHISCANRWRVLLQNTDSCFVSPMALAAAMQVDSVFSVHFLPDLSFELDAESVVLTSLSNSTTESMRLSVGNAKTSVRLWNSSKQVTLLVAKTQLSCCVDMMDYANMTWLPFLLPSKFIFQVKKNSESIDASLECDKLVVHLSQKLVHSFSHLIRSLSTASETAHCGYIQLKNRTCATLLLGQVQTDECIKLSAQSDIIYSWRSNKVEQLLHVSVERLTDWNWSDSFQISFVQEIICKVDHNTAILVVVKKPTTLETVVEFCGPTQLINRLPFSVQCVFVMLGDNVTNSKDVVLHADTVHNLLFPISKVASLSLHMPGIAHEFPKVFVPKLVTTSGNSAEVQFLNQDESLMHCQVVFHKSDFVDTLAVVPLFIVRSHLPDPCFLHIETRSSHCKSTVMLQGKGEELGLLTLPPFTTHHLTVQINEHQSPFDARVPIHSSLVYTMDETQDVTGFPLSLSKVYPYNQADADDTEDSWSSGDGNIHARLSLYSGSLLVEITPWCLFHNETTEVLCILSPTSATTIVQPGQTVVPHHFDTVFQIQTINGSGSGWMTLACDKDMQHPSRKQSTSQGYVAPNSIREVMLRKKNKIVDILLKSCVRYGIRILTVTSKWWFVNNSSAFPQVQVKPCTCKDEKLYLNCKDMIGISTSNPVPLLCWQNEPEFFKSEEDGAGDIAQNQDSIVTSADETSSSFLCVEGNANSVSLNAFFIDQSLYLSFPTGVALVSVGDIFEKKVVDVCHCVGGVQALQLLLTKHYNNDTWCLALNDITSHRYRMHNELSAAFMFREVTGQQFHVNQVVYPGQNKVFESHMDAEDFPQCRRIFRSIKLQLSKLGEDNWTELVVPDVQHDNEVAISGFGKVHVHVKRLGGCVEVALKDIGCEKDFACDKRSSIQTSYNCHIHVNEMKLVLLDDLGNPLLSKDVLHVCVDKVAVKLLSDPLTETWDVQLTVLQFQVDNRLFLSEKWPVVLWSNPEEAKTPIALRIGVFLTQNFCIDSFDVWLGTLEFKSDNSFTQILSHLLQSYIDSYLKPTSPLNYDLVPPSLQNEVNAFCNPVRLTSINIHPFMLFVSMRASLKVQLSIDRGAISFSKFVCRDVDTTAVDLLQEISRHYVADAVYGAGWVLGSLDLLGNPASTLRSFGQGVTDFVALPYRGLASGPSGFVAGFAQGLSSLLLHLSSGTLRSVTNIAAGISRNLGAETGNVSEYSKIPQPSVLSPEATRSSKPESSYVAGFGKALASVIALPVGGAANIVSKAGESILRRVGVEKYLTARYEACSHATAFFQNSASKYTDKIVPADTRTENSLAVILPGCMISSIGEDFEVELVLLPPNLYVLRMEDDTVETVLSVKDIQLHLEYMDDSNCYLTLQHSASTATGSAVYEAKVAAYLGMEKHAKKSSAETTDFIQYNMKVKNCSEAALFCAIFSKFRSKLKNFDW